MTTSMKNNLMWRGGLVLLVATVLLITTAITSPAVAAGEQDTGFALLLQSSPANGGSIMPGDGVHRIQIGGSVPLIAVPKQGYRFLYWLGDVGQTDRTRTSVQMDGPKLVVAVFEREQFEDLLDAGIPQGASYGGLYASSLPGSGGSIEGSNWTPDDGGGGGDDGGDEDDPFPVPEPMTVLLLGIGGVFMARRKRG